MSRITSHVLDTSSGKPAAGIKIILSAFIEGGWKVVSEKSADSDGRVRDFSLPGEYDNPGMFRVRFEVQEYFESKGMKTFYPFAEITFYADKDEHYHIPLLLSPFGYTTYRGS